MSYEKIKFAINDILLNVDYTTGACNLVDMVGAALPPSSLSHANAALQEEDANQDSPEGKALMKLLGSIDYTKSVYHVTSRIGAALPLHVIEDVRNVANAT